jgi:hypothetical protein
MSRQTSSSDQRKIPAAVIAAVVGGIFVVLAACVTGGFLLTNTLLEKRVEVPTSQPSTPVAQPEIPASTRESGGPSVQSLGTIRIFGNSNSGVQIRIPESGIYRFAYRDGAYATYAVGNEPPNMNTWLTAVFIFRGDQALWDGRRIKDESLLLRLADMKYRASAEEAEKAAQGQYVEAQLNQGDVLTLIAADYFDAYADNPGQVVVEWFLVKY